GVGDVRPEGRIRPLRSHGLALPRHSGKQILHIHIEVLYRYSYPGNSG
uniref:Uncharacterized protein n=1 Tax=Myotis lucifugus TaxID=59463 RepID=G1Q794_MYOLU